MLVVHGRTLRSWTSFLGYAVVTTDTVILFQPGSGYPGRAGWLHC